MKMRPKTQSMRSGATSAAVDDAALERLEVWFSISEVARLMRTALDERMRAMGLTGAAWRILARLSRQDGQTQAGLARLLEITPVALGETVDRLEKSGHVRRCADPTDRRKRRIHLTAKSRELLPQMREIADALQAECFESVSDAELAALGRTLSRLRARIQELKIDRGDEEIG